MNNPDFCSKPREWSLQLMLRGFFFPRPIADLCHFHLAGFILAARTRDLQAIRANPY